MIENINDFLSLALLVCFLLAIIINLFHSYNKTRVNKHIQEESEYYHDYYDDSDDLD